MARVGRNEPCPCGSGSKYKKCCIGKPLVTSDDGTVSIMDERTVRARENLERGYQCFYQNNEGEAVQYWQRLWEDYVRDKLNETAVDAFDDHMDSSESFSDWFVEYPMVLQNMALQDSGFGKQVLDYCDTMLARGRGHLPELKESLGLAKAVALSGLGHDKEADEEFRNLSEAYPDYCRAYLEWSDHLQDSSKERAREVLELGLQRCGDLFDREMLNEHIEDLDEDLDE